jgi:hypothetical protein
MSQKCHKRSSYFYFGIGTTPEAGQGLQDRAMIQDQTSRRKIISSKREDADDNVVSRALPRSQNMD